MNAADLKAELEMMNSQVVTKVCGHDVTRGQLEFAFNQVAPKANWKNPIDEEVFFDCDFDLMRMHAAIEFFTGSKATITSVRGLRTGAIYRVKAAGYYKTIGA